MLVHNPPEHVEAISRLLSSAKRILLLGDGYADAVAEAVAQMFRHRGIDAEYLPNDAVKKASSLMSVDSSVLVIGISASDYGRDVARAMEYAAHTWRTHVGRHWLHGQSCQPHVRDCYLCSH